MSPRDVDAVPATSTFELPSPVGSTRSARLGDPVSKADRPAVDDNAVADTASGGVAPAPGPEPGRISVAAAVVVGDIDIILNCSDPPPDRAATSSAADLGNAVAPEAGGDAAADPVSAGPVPPDDGWIWGGEAVPGGVVPGKGGDTTPDPWSAGTGAAIVGDSLLGDVLEGIELRVTGAAAWCDRFSTLALSRSTLMTSATTASNATEIPSACAFGRIVGTSW
jgi:hypothetical protein